MRDRRITAIAIGELVLASVNEAHFFVELAMKSVKEDDSDVIMFADVPLAGLVSVVRGHLCLY